MLLDQRDDPRPGRECEQRFNEASANESAGAKALAPRPAKRVQFLDEGCYLEERTFPNKRLRNWQRKAANRDLFGHPQNLWIGGHPGEADLGLEHDAANRWEGR